MAHTLASQTSSPLIHTHLPLSLSHTLGGFYLARYTDSPVGAFDEVRERGTETISVPSFTRSSPSIPSPPSHPHLIPHPQLVAMAGLVWNAPTSCAWAARVYVSNREARDHGRRSVGLPSAMAAFEAAAGAAAPAAADPAPVVLATSTPRARFARRRSVRPPAPPAPPAPPSPSWWEVTAPAFLAGMGGAPPAGASLLSVRAEDCCQPTSSTVSLALPPGPPPKAWAGPRLTLALPSFSGGTLACPALLKYACTLATAVRPLAPARVVWDGGEGEGGAHPDPSLRRLLSGRPLMALQFGDMTMTVQEPVRVAVKSGDKGRVRRAALLA